MADKLVTVTIADGKTLQYKDEGEKVGGEEIEVWRSQERRLRAAGLLAPKKRSEAKEAPADEPTTEG